MAVIEAKKARRVYDHNKPFIYNGRDYSIPINKYQMKPVDAVQVNARMVLGGQRGEGTPPSLDGWPPFLRMGTTLLRVFGVSDGIAVRLEALVDEVAVTYESLIIQHTAGWETKTLLPPMCVAHINDWIVEMPHGRLAVISAQVFMTLFDALDWPAQP